MYIDDNNNADTNIGAILDPLWTVIYGIWTHDLYDTFFFYWCSALPTELTSRPRWIFLFIGFIFTTTSVVYITARIAFIFLLQL